MRRVDVCLLLAGTCLLPAFISSNAAASHYQVLYSFCHGNKFVCADGKAPAADLVADDAGNFYGTTTAGGSTNNGVIFKLSKAKHGYKYQVLHSFDGAAEGGVPVTPLVRDADGNLYGTATADGTNFGGTVFELSPDTTQTQWTYKVLINFCSDSSPDCLQGMVPESPLTYAGAAAGAPYDGLSPLYGTTLEGGANGVGMAYSLTPDSSTWTPKLIYSFCSVTNCADGEFPVGQLVLNERGNLFGTTIGGGSSANSSGVVYKIEPKSGAETVLYNFCSATDCADGSSPLPGVTRGRANHLFGATSVGGKHGSGTVYELNPRTQKEHVLYSFCRELGCSDGVGPVPPVVEDHGSLVGTASGGDGESNGVIYRIGASNNETILYTFCQKVNCADGAAPVGVIATGTSALFGMTQRGGNRNQGVIFKLVP